MGDRGNIVFVDRMDKKVGYTFLYTHWGGSGIKEVLQEALLKRWRWNDPSYLCRITADVLMHDAHDTETGFGISPFLGDNSHPILLVDTGKQRVFIVKEHVMQQAVLKHAEIAEWLSVYSFEDFAAYGSTDATEDQERE